MKTTTAQMSVRRTFHRRYQLLKLTQNVTIEIPAKSIWSSTCKNCLTTYETHTHQDALNKAAWHLTHMQPCQRLPEPLTIHECDQDEDAHPLLPSL